MQPRLGTHFEREIREQPALWSRIAASGAAQHLADALDGDAGMTLVGSGSSLFAAQLGALALRRRGIDAHALAATEARLDRNAYRHRIVVAVSQSGRSSDLLDAIELLQPLRLVAVTNTPESPLGARANTVVDVAAGIERAVPASKSVSATAALLLWAASLLATDGRRDGAMLDRTAHAIDHWLEDSESPGGGIGDVALAAERIARRSNVVVLGSDYGLPIALEASLKLKEACYVHAEGFASGEFRHGSIAMVDASYAVLGIVDDDALGIVARPLREIATSEALRYTIGNPQVDDIASLGPRVETPFNTLAWLVTAQLIALFAARARHIDPDTPRGLSKALVTERA